jgi:hypothetical protein
VAGAGAIGEKGGPSGQNRTADEPGQTLNVDLCFVPAVHEVAEHLPAVSGSSGRLVVYGLRHSVEEGERTWPDQVFEDAELAYAAAMQEFVQRSAPRTPVRQARQQPEEPAEPAADRLLRQQRRQLSGQRAQVLARRRQEDAAWREVCRQRQARLRPEQWTPRQYSAYLAAEDYWLLLQDQRQAALARRQQEDATWHAELARLAPPPMVPAWSLTDLIVHVTSYGIS